MSGDGTARSGGKRPVAFISHHSSQVETARRLKRILDRNGIGGWLAPDDVQPGRPFDQAIIEQVRGSDLIILLFCSRSDQSRHVKRELMMAENEDKLIYPVRLEEIEAFGLAYWLNDYQWVDWFDGKDKSIERMVNTVKEQFGLPDTSPEPPAPPPSQPVIMPPDPEPDPAPLPAEPKPVPPPPPDPEPPVSSTPISAKSETPAADQTRRVPKPAKPEGTDGEGGDKRKMLLIGAGIAALLLVVLLFWLLSGSEEEGEGEAAAGSSRLSPSVDCADLSSPAHELICNSAELAARERQVAAAYEAATAAASDDAARTALENAQAEFIARRDGCDNSACIDAAYIARLEQLGASTAPPPPEPLPPQQPDGDEPAAVLPGETRPSPEHRPDPRAPVEDTRRPPQGDTTRPTPTPAPPPPPPPSPASAATPPRPANNPASWVTQSDYPSNILRNGESGTSRFQLRIGPDGVPTGCFTTGTSGHFQLDARACNMARARARFTPARDANGNPTSSTYSGSFTWRAP